MATQSNSLPSSLLNVDNAPAGAERRREPRYGAEGEVTVVVCKGVHEHELTAKLLDFSLHGLRVRLPQQIAAGTQVHVFFSWGEVSTQVARCTPAPTGFDIGLQLF